MSIACLVEPERYRTAMPASQPDKSGSASASSTSGKFSGQWRRSGVPISASLRSSYTWMVVVWLIEPADKVAAIFPALLRRSPFTEVTMSVSVRIKSTNVF